MSKKGGTVDRYYNQVRHRNVWLKGLTIKLMSKATFLVSKGK